MNTALAARPVVLAIPKQTTGAKRPLSPAMATLLRYGDRDRAHHEVERAVFTAMVRSGWSWADAWEVMQNPENLAGLNVRDKMERRGVAAARKYVQRNFEAQVRFAAANPQVSDHNGARFAIAEIRMAADASAWSDRTGPTDRAVLEGLLRLGEERGRLAGLAVSVREIAIAAGIGSPATVSRSLGRLKGWVTRTGADAYGKAHSYSMHRPPTADTSETLCLPPERHLSVSDTSALVAHPAWRYDSLGKRPWQVYRTLSSEPVSTSALAATCGVTARSIRRALATLREAGLAERTVDGWRTRKISDANQLDSIAAACGSDVRAAAQRERFREQSEQFKRGVLKQRHNRQEVRS